MSERAQITSVEAIESFRASVIIFLGQARPVLEEVGNEMSRMQLWLQEDQRRVWETELRRRERRLEEAKQELYNATLSSLQTGNTALLQMTVQRTHRAVEEARAKLAMLKKWGRELENRTAPLLKQTEQLQGFLATDMSRAVAYLDQVLKALEAYQNVTPVRSEKAAGAEPVLPEETK